MLAVLVALPMLARAQKLVTQTEAIDSDAMGPSVTVLSEDGRTQSFKVEDKNNLKDDKVEITSTVAVMIGVK